MKKSTLLFFLVMWSLSFNTVTAQQILFKNQAKDAVVQNNPRTAGSEFVPGELIVKFKDNLTVKSTGAKFKSASVSTDALQTKYNVQKAEALFPGEVRLKSAQMLTAPNGQQFLRPSLHNIYKLKIADEKQLMNAISDFKADTANVVYAEPNYIISICNDKPIGPILTETDVKRMQSAKAPSETQAVVDDPMYSQQWYIPAVKADLVWPQTKGDTTQIIAILDTGVDWLHPDLKNKIWKNPKPSTSSYPDGILNDIRGWDYINNDNDPIDDNSHGTHVAGIAAAETNNGIGIAGICPNAKIMPIKVFQSSGRGDAATIAKGIKYAASHGATVINMSFGSYVDSKTMDDALANAYATCVLVAAAGNDGSPIGPPVAPFYPAALSFVLGVQSPEASFSNYDQDGPIFSGYSDLLNYEMKAPGTNILSTVPNGGYRIYQGTSMAAPIISGIVALYKKQKPTDSQELLYGNLINSIGTNVDIQKALSIVPVPQLAIVSYEIVDTLDGDRDGHADAGETIEFNVKIRNSWGPADSVYVGIRFKEFEDVTTANIEKGSAFIGSIGPYSTLTNSKNLLRIKIQPSVVHNRDINFVLQTWKGYKKEFVSEQDITIRVENGSELKGVLEDTLRLSSGKFWLVSNSFKIGPTGVLIINPGTEIKVERQISNNGQIFMEGIKDKRITFNGPYGISGGFLSAKYTDFIDLYSTDNNLIDFMPNGNYDNCTFRDFSTSYRMCNGGNFNNCIISSGVCSSFSIGASFTFSNVYSIYPSWGFFWEPTSSHGELSNTNFYAITGTLLSYGGSKTIHDVNFLGSNLKIKAIEGTTFQIPSNYWGTIDSLNIENKLFHFWDESNRALIKYQPLLKKPSSKAHACVWKIVVNGKDSQDEFKSMDPLGVGNQTFKVYFNRPMDIKYPPTVSMGVRDPYNQVMISDNGSWSADSLIYTVSKNIGLTTNNGLNRIKVINGKDTEGFDLVPESDRFNVNIQTCASASADFIATPGLGKVKMEWNNNQLADVLGFNMYRMEYINDSTHTKPIMINKSVIADTLYTDFDVTPNKKYYYYYKIIRTNLTETDSSKIVTATPFTASKGDGNGDLKVDVLDITTIVAYLLGQNPTPFIFEAADVNGDKAINVLDVVAVANLIKNGKSAPADDGNKYNPTIAYITLKPEIIQLKSDAQVAAVQFELQGVELEKVKLSAALKGFELAYSNDGNKITGILYNLNGLTIPAGITDLILIEAGGGKLTWGKVFGADPQSKYVTIMKLEDVSLTTPTNPFGLSVQPNPSGSDMQISLRLPGKAYVTVKVYNVMGALVSQLMDNAVLSGNQQLIWGGTNGNGETVKAGVYFIRVEARDEKNQTLKEQMKVVRL